MGCGAGKPVDPETYWTRKDGVFEVTEEITGLNNGVNCSGECAVKPFPAGRSDCVSGGLSYNFNLRFQRGDKTVADNEYEIVYPTPEEKPQTMYKCPPCAMDVEASWYWMRDPNDPEKKHPLQGFIIITLERRTAEGTTVIATEEIGPCAEIDDDQRAAGTGWTDTTKSWSLSDTIVKDCKDGDVFKFEYKVGRTGCKTVFKMFKFNIQWMKSEALKAADTPA